MSEERDLRDGYPEYRKPPPDVVRKKPPTHHGPPIIPGPGSYRHDVISEDGVTREEGAAYIAQPMMPKPQGEEGK